MRYVRYGLRLLAEMSAADYHLATVRPAPFWQPPMVPTYIGNLHLYGNLAKSAMRDCCSDTRAEIQIGDGRE